MDRFVIPVGVVTIHEPDVVYQVSLLVLLLVTLGLRLTPAARPGARPRA